MRDGRLQVEHVRHVQRRGAGARIGVAADDLAVQRRADDRQFFVVLRLGQLRPRRLHRRLLGDQGGLRRVDGVLRLVELLLGDEVVGRQLLQTIIFTLGGADIDLGQRLGAFGLGDGRLGRADGQALGVVFLARQDLVLGDTVAFLDQDVAHRAGRTGSNLDDAAFDVDLAVGDGRIGRWRHLDGRLGAGLAAGHLHVATRQGNGQGHDGQGGDGNGAEQSAGHACSLRN